MLTDYVVRGLKAGAVAGLAFGLFVALVASPLIGHAESLGHEDGHAHGEAAAESDHAHGEEGAHSHESSESGIPVTGAVSVVSGVLWGVLLGALGFGAVFYFLEPALPGTDAGKSLVLGAAGFVTVSGAPWLVLPPSPPGVEHSLAIGARLRLYVGMMVAGALACGLAIAAYNRLRDSHGRPLAGLAAVASLGLLAVPAALAPSDVIESALPADLALGMTGVTVFGQVALWAILAVSHAWLARGDDAGAVAFDRAHSDASPASD